MKKTKVAAVLLSAVLALGTGSVLAGCRRNFEDEEAVDPNKTQVRVGYYDGGLGREWIQEAERIYEKENPDIQIFITKSKSRYESTSMLSSYYSYNEDIFFVDTASYREYKNEDFYYDITEAVSTPLTEYGESKSILDKMNESYKEYYLETVEGKSSYYAVPFYDSFYFIIYDMDLFEEKSLYMDGNGNFSDGSVKSVGKDGIPRTYDDGLPTTMEEFFELCNVMLYERGIKPFTFTGSENAYYPTKMMENYWASYEGYDNYLLNYTLDSNEEAYTFLDGTSEAITIKNGYKLKDGQPGKKAAVQFLYNILKGYNGKGQNGDYHSSKVFASSQDNRAAQDEFLFSTNTSQSIAFLIDATWWEREAVNSFADLVKRTDESNAYGTRRFGIMPMPTVHEGGGNTDVFSAVGENSQVFINKNTEVPEEAIDFFRFIHSDRILSLMTSYSNTLRPYQYTVTDTDKERMTPLGRQLAEGNSSFTRVPPLLLNKAVNENDPGFYSWQQWQFGTTGQDYYPITLFYNDKSLTVDEFMEKMKIDPKEWEKAFSIIM